LTELNWFWIAVMGTVPPMLAAIVASPLWRRTGMIFGSLVGTGVIFASAFALIAREYAEIDRFTKGCLDVGVVCFPKPSAFTRFAIYACIGLVQVFVLFSVGLVVEERTRRRDYAPEWR
jgi:hypothetical protein